MKFNNRPNEKIEIDDRVIWVSRSSASIMTVNCQIEGIEYILMMKRGHENVLEEKGKWCLPCGFIDWDENGLEAAIRETWEEAGINVLEDFEGSPLLYGLNEQPWQVVSTPDEYQNISLHFGISAKVTELPEIRGPQGGEEGETEEVKWVQYEDIGDLDIAFNHEERVRQFLIHRNWARHHTNGE